MTEVSSPGCLFRGKPSSTRSGPKGDIQRPPIPTDLLKSPKLNTESDGHIFFLLPVLESVIVVQDAPNALPISKKATPRNPYCSAMGNSNSVLRTAALSPPITSFPQLSWSLVLSFFPQPLSRGPKLRSEKPRMELMPPKKYLSKSGRSFWPSARVARPTPYPSDPPRDNT